MRAGRACLWAGRDSTKWTCLVRMCVRAQEARMACSTTGRERGGHARAPELRSPRLMLARMTDSQKVTGPALRWVGQRFWDSAWPLCMHGPFISPPRLAPLRILHPLHCICIAECRGRCLCTSTPRGGSRCGRCEHSGRNGCFLALLHCRGTLTPIPAQCPSFSLLHCRRSSPQVHCWSAAPHPAHYRS